MGPGRAGRSFCVAASSTNLQGTSTPAVLGKGNKNKVSFLAFSVSASCMILRQIPPSGTSASSLVNERFGPMMSEDAQNLGANILPGLVNSLMMSMQCPGLELNGSAYGLSESELARPAHCFPFMWF